MSDWLILGVYIAGWVLAYRRIYVATDESFGGPDDAVDTAMFIFMAAFGALFWPLAVPLWLAHRFLTPTTPRERREALYEREHEASLREMEIRRLERELGITDRTAR